MKKLVFTAIAVIAFSGVSMAETKEVEETNVAVSLCEDIAIVVMDNWYGSQFLTDVGFIYAYRAIVEDCDSGREVF
jgi:hypothetical protein